MFTKSKIVGIILTMVIAGSVWGGGSRQTTTGRTVDGNSRELRVLNYANMTQANTATDWGNLVGTFRENNPDISLLIEDLFNEPFHQKTEAYAASGNLPDVLYVWPSGRSTSLHQNRQLKDLTRLINRDGLRNEFLPITFDVSQQASGYQAMFPRAVTNTHIFMVNNEVLRAAGLQPARTYAELKAQVPVLRARGLETVVMANESVWVMQSCLFSMIAGRFCGLDWDKKIHDGSMKFTDPDFVAALDFIRQLYEDGVIARSSLGLGYGDGPGYFAAGRGAYYIDGDWVIGNFITDASTGQALIPVARQSNFAVTVFPTIEGAKVPSRTNSSILGTGWAMSAAIPDNSPREEAAWTFIKWIISREMMTVDVNHGAYSTPTRTNIRSQDLQLEPLQVAVSNLGTQFDGAAAVIDGVFHSDIYGVINTVLQEIGLGSKTPQAGAADIQRAFDSAPSKK
jgi:raffinose/stachyose/melibiose transport system substrate-binding protein